jgi:hypothetical protein
MADQVLAMRTPFTYLYERLVKFPKDLQVSRRAKKEQSSKDVEKIVSQKIDRCRIFISIRGMAIMKPELLAIV